MNLLDALFNWLQIKIVSEARPDDTAAKSTTDFFADILSENHKVTELKVEKDETMYRIRYDVDGKTKTQMYDIDSVEKLLHDIESEPRYNT